MSLKTHCRNLLILGFGFWVSYASAQYPIGISRNLTPAFFQEWNLDADTNKIIVEDPDTKFFAELPGGNVELANYHAPFSVLDAYAKEFKLNEGDKKDNPKAPNCTRAEIHALTAYTTNDIYKVVNATLRQIQNGKVNGETISKKLESEILVIASGVNCAPQWQGTVVRGEATPPGILAQYIPEKHILSRGFTSTTKGEKLTQWFVEHSTQKIIIQKARGADIHLMDISQWKDEKEVLLRPGTVFKVVSRVDNDPTSVFKNDFVFMQR